LETVTEHGTIGLGQQPRLHVDDQVRSDADEVGVVGGVVDLAQRQTVWHHRLPVWFAVGDDVGGIEQLRVMKAADGTAVVVGPQDACPEDGLMKSGIRQPSYVGPLGSRQLGQIDKALVLVHRHDEVVPRDVFGYQPDGIARDVDASVYSNEVGEGQSLGHGGAEGTVVGVLRISASILVPDEAIIANIVGVGRKGVRRCVGGPDREGSGEVGWLPDAGLHDEANRPTFEGEGVDDIRPQGAVGTRCQYVGEVSEHGRPKPSVSFLAEACHAVVVAASDPCFLGRRVRIGG
jgi:hypothetical protein